MAPKKKKQAAKAAPRLATPKTTPVVSALTGSRTAREPVDFARALLGAWRVNDRITHELLALVAPHIWRAFPQSSKRRNIATSFAHIHNVRCMRIKMSHSTVAVPERLDRAEVTPDDARKALAESADAMAALIQLGLDAGGHVPNYQPDVVALVCYAITHEAHHRGQISHWCRELGVPITPEQSLGMWEWDKLHKKVNRES
jgi:uncharacterized damage-inducible protein DinB